jgi:hypothetical protein
MDGRTEAWGLATMIHEAFGIANPGPRSSRDSDARLDSTKRSHDRRRATEMQIADYCSSQSLSFENDSDPKQICKVVDSEKWGPSLGRPQRSLYRHGSIQYHSKEVSIIPSQVLVKQTSLCFQRVYRTALSLPWEEQTLSLLIIIIYHRFEQRTV